MNDYAKGMVSIEIAKMGMGWVKSYPIAEIWIDNIYT